LQRAPPPDTAIFSDNIFSATPMSVRNAPDLSLPAENLEVDPLYGDFENG
jgi:hypothetical protein